MQLRRDGVVTVGPGAGEMAEAGEAGVGRMSEPTEIAAAAEHILRPPRARPLAGKPLLITPGPTPVPRAPVRYLPHRAPGQQGFAVATADPQARAGLPLG